MKPLDQVKSIFFWSCFLILVFEKTVLAFTASFNEEISFQDKKIASMKVLIKDQKLRVESSMEGFETIIIRNESGTYNYFPERKAGAKLPEAAKAMNFIDYLADFPRFLKENQAVRTGAERIQETDCEIYEFKDPVSQTPSKVWARKTDGFPLKIEMASPPGPTTIEFSAVRLNEPLDDALFEVPADIQVTDMSGMIVQSQAPPGGG